MIFIKYDFEMPKYSEEEFKEHQWTKKQWENFIANDKVTIY